MAKTSTPKTPPRDETYPEGMEDERKQPDHRPTDTVKDKDYPLETPED